jgi:pimeloyl-ACP methyl ester carboxylesterase
MDLPGFGKSTRRAGDLLLTVRTITTVIQERTHKNVSILGHSMGGILALAVAGDTTPHADIRGVTLLSSPPLTAARIIARPARALAHPQTAFNLTFQAIGASLPMPRTLTSRVLRSATARRLLLWPYVANPEDLNGDELARSLSSNGGVATIRALTGARSIDLEQLLARCTLPVHLIRGQQDQLVSADDISEAEAALPVSRSTTIDDCGHWPHIERPMDVVAAVRNG